MTADLTGFSNSFPGRHAWRIEVCVESSVRRLPTSQTTSVREEQDVSSERS